MTKIKICGLSRPEDVQAANELRPDMIGFVFWPKSSRYVTPGRARELRALLADGITAVGVFVDEDISLVSELLMSGTIDMAQLHGSESDGYIDRLGRLTGKPVIRAFRIGAEEDVRAAERSPADLVLLDSGAGSGRTFDWSLIKDIKRRYLLAGGLDKDNVGRAVRTLHPYGVDVSSMVETNGRKDSTKMAEFISAVRKELAK